MRRHCLVAAGLLVLGACGAERVPPPNDAPQQRAHRVRHVLGELPGPPGDGLSGVMQIEDRGGRALEAFSAALERAAAGRGTVRIVAYGGSHTASDLWTGVLRERLARAFGDAGRGFVLPVPPIDRYWQHGVRVAEAEGWTVLEPSNKRTGIDRYGIAGIAFEAREAAWAEVSMDGSRASRIEVMYLRQPGGGTLEVSIDGALHRIDTSGEREEAAIAGFGVPDGGHRIVLRSAGRAPVRIFGLVLERERSGVIVDQLGLAGAKARHHLLWDEDVWGALLRTRRPDLFLLSYGNNELDDHHLPLEAYERHFARMLGRLQRHFPKASCVVLGPSDRRYPGPHGTWKTPSLLAVLVAMQRRVAHAHGCGFVDVLAWQGGAGAVERWLAASPPLARDDRIHFTEPGYRRFGEALLRALLEAQALR